MYYCKLPQEKLEFSQGSVTAEVILKMELLLLAPTKEVDVDLLVFVERYATDLLKWDILTLFARNPSFSASASQIAQHVGRNAYLIQPELGDLALLGILEQTPGPGNQMLYQLTPKPHLRRIILKFADQLVEQPFI